MNIVIVTSYYPNSDGSSYGTKAIHNFTKEWVKQGHKVVVLFNTYQATRLLKPFVKKNYIKKYEEYSIEGVSVIHNVFTRYIPKSNFIFPSIIRAKAKQVVELLEDRQWKPDKICVHYCTENWQFSRNFACLMNLDAVPIFHKCDINREKQAKRILGQVSIAGARSRPIEEKIRKMAADTVSTFFVPSGSPNLGISCVHKGIEKKKGSFLYAGDLIQLKNVDILIEAFSAVRTQSDDKCSLTIVGDGVMRSELENLVESKNMKKHIRFTGKLPHDKVLTLMEETETFVMVSSPETFGLVYMEALASGCLVIGSKGEGIDGIIENGVNGFLVEPRNTDELTKALTSIVDMDFSTKKLLIERGYQTSKKYSEENVALEYARKIAET